MRKDRINKTQVNNKKIRKEKRGLNNKGKRVNVKNLPTFILIGLILMIIIIAIIYYVFLRYAPEQIITYSGYAIEGQALAENLKNSDISNVKPYLDLVEVQENDLLYKRLNSYYVGEDDKKEIDINYPIYINEGNALLNIGKDTKLITVNYEEVEGYPEFMMTDGVMYNGADLTRADGNKYIFLKSEDEIYTNVGAIKITTATNTYNIKEFSNIYFTENSITYYEMEEDSNVQNWYMKYKRIDDIDNNSKIEVKGETISYKTFLERLGLIDSEENVNNTDKEKTTNEISENTVEKPEQVNEESSANENNNATTGTTEGKEENQESEWQEGMWEKPEVSCTDFEGEVYTIRTNLSVRDRAGVITRGITFEIYLDGRLNRRVQASQAGTLEITNLQPSSEYEIRGIFYYNDENGVEQEEEFYTGKVTTKSIDTLGTLDFSFQNGKIYSNKIELIHLKLNNNINEEVVRGISRVQVEIGDVAYRLTNAQIDELKAGKEITYQTSENLTSNSKIKYEITAFDRFGNELKEKNNEGETITSKQMPTASIRPTKQDVTEIEIEVVLNNKDNVKLENYRYEITNPSGDIVKQGILGTGNSNGSNNGQVGEDGSLIAGGNINDGHKETLKFNDLDPNGYYQIVIYGDYDLEDGTGIKENAELGRGSFVTRPIASLGYMQVKIDDKEITQNSMDLGISIDENQTDARLLAILDKVEVVIYDEGKNTDNDGQQGQEEQSKETEVQRITFMQEQVQQIKTSEEVELSIEQLNSNTKYRIDVITTVRQGTVEEVVEDKQNIEQLITLKMPAEVQIKNQFVIGTMIDLDMRIEDIDNAVLTNKVRIEVRDKDNKLIDLSEMQTNADYERKTYEDLTPNEEYRIIVYAPQYNIGSTDKTYKADYILKEIKIVTETGISGRLDLIGLEKTPTGKNLIDVSSKVNWFERCFNISNKYGLSYNEENKILKLGGSMWTNNINYYDLSKYLGQQVTISFKAREQNNTNLDILEINNNDFIETKYTAYYTINDLNNEWQEYNYTVTLSKTGYIGFYVTANNAVVEMQDLQIELGNKKTDYEEFKYDYNANIAVTVNDERNEIVTNDYYIRIYKNNEQIQELRYEEIGENNKVENAQKTYNIEPDANYKIELLVKIGERFYELDSQEFSTEGSREVKGIFNLQDYLKIQPYGEYIVLDYIDLSNAKYSFGVVNVLSFDGTIDFNGNKLINADYFSDGNRVFQEMGSTGIIENIVFEVKINGKTPVNAFGGLTQINYGTIRNVQINVIESIEKANYTVFLMAYDNYGTIENFVVNYQEPIYAEYPSLTYVNHGILRNGYMYGKNIQEISQTTKLTGAFTKSNNDSGMIENIYTLVNIDNVYKTHQTANIAGNNNNNATVQNVYSVGIGKNVTDLTRGPTVYSKNSTKVYNNYYFADEIFTSELETKGNMLSLWDSTFQNQILNSDGAFIVDELVNEGYYPQIKMPECMPAQEFIELPEVKDADLPDILSTKILEQGTNTVKVEFSVNNPNAETISNIQIENLEVEILSQEYSNKKSTVIAELKNPLICVSSYDVLSISTKGAYGSSYTRPYEKGERVINVDLYKEIWNINDWKAIKDSPTENYMLMADLNFANEGNAIYIDRDIYGILNGNGHSISNIYLTGNTQVIRGVYGTIKNLTINNFNQEEVITFGGFINYLGSSSIVDNVHMVDVKIHKSGDGRAGTLSNDAGASMIKNSSAQNITIITEGNQSTLHIGGLIGRISNTTIENCYVKGLSVKDEKAINSGIGGIVGVSANSNNIENCYVEGKINSANLNVGGIIGNSSNDNIENCYSKVDISATNNNIGEIVGSYAGSSLEAISNNLSIGNIYTSSGLDGMNRILGSNEGTESNNYAYENQLLNGYIREEAKGATLLGKEEVLNLNLGESYNYDKKEEGILPKLYNTEGTELLPNQDDIFLDNSDTIENVELEVESIEASKPNTTEAEVTVKIKNPKGVEITGLGIEDMEVTAVTRNVTQNGITSITVSATPTRYYDSYKLTGIKYKTKSVEEQTKEIEVEIPVQFYKEIYTYEDWQGIEEGTYQNYRLMADIDFSGKSSIKNNITVNRLEAENNLYTLKNITLEFNKGNTGLINNVKTSIKNIGFENITLTNTGSGSYFGVISNSNADIENLKFTNITIDNTGGTFDEVGVIGGTTSGNINNVELKNINVKGNTDVGGFIGQINIGVETTIQNISGDNINVEGKTNYAGGIIGRQTGTNIKIENIKIENSNVKGNGYTGGIIGVVYNISLKYLETNNTEISGGSYVGGVIGFSSMSTIWFSQVNSSNISGTGNLIGGVVGQCSSSSPYYVVVKNSKINALSTNSKYIGGIAGNNAWCGVYYYAVIDTEIISNGTNVGGVTNNSEGENDTSSVEAKWGYVKNTVVQGNSSVGGIIGYGRMVGIQVVYVNAEVKANIHSAGGLVGYGDNKYMTGATNRLVANGCMVIDSTITAPTKAGGYFGDIAKELYRTGNYYTNNYIEADVISENSSTGSLLIGGRPDENDYVLATYIYKYSTLNGDYVYSTNDNIDNKQYLVRTDLEQQNTYLSKIGIGITYWNYASLTEGKYPKILDSYLYKPELQEGVDLPVDPEISSLNILNEENEDNLNSNNQNNLTEQNGITSDNEKVTEDAGALPSYTVYPVSVNEINVDFSEVVNNYKVEGNNEQQGEQTSSADTRTYFTYYVNGEEKETVELSNSTKQTYTFKYNFRDTLEIKLTREDNVDLNNVVENTQTNLTSDESASTKINMETNAEIGTKTNIHTEIIIIKPEDVRSEASLVGSINAYLLGTNLYINGELQQGEYVNVYEGLALKSDGTVINIATNENVEQNVETVLEENAKPLETHNYKDYRINTYGTYSTVNGNIKLQIYNVRSGKLSALSNTMDIKIGNNITDNYNDKEYQTILATEGNLVDLKEMLKYPENFLTRNIKQIAQNTDEEKTEMIVLYNTGKVIVFNYVTGEVIYENNEKADSGLVDYLEGSISNIWNNYEEKQQEYAKSKELEQKLAKLPIEEALKEIMDSSTDDTNGVSRNPNKLEENNNTANKDIAQGTTSGNEDRNSGNNSNTSTDNSYVSVYNAETKEYEVYSENEILNESGETPVSETEKIKQNGLEGIYGYNAKEETKPQTNGAIIVIATIVVAVIALVILRKIVVKNNTKKKK